jgi:phosphohistidine swiveling domain-containing protein
MKSYFKNELEQWGPIDAKPLYTGFWFGPMAGRGMRKYGCRWPRIVGIYQKNKVTWVWEKKTLEESGSRAINLWIQNFSNWEKIKKDYFRLTREQLAISRKIQKSLKQTPDNVLRGLFRQRYLSLDKHWSLTLVFEMANYASPFFLSKKLSKYVSGENINSVLEVLLAPNKLSFHQQSEKELLEILVKKSENYQKRINKFVQKWFWIENSYFESFKLSAESFIKKYKKIKPAELRSKFKAVLNYLPRLKKRKNLVIKRYKLPKQIVQLSERLAESIWLQDHRKGFIWQTNSITDEFNHYQAHRLKIKMEDIMYYTGEEWFDLMVKEKIVDASEIKKRRDCFVVVLDKPNYSILSGITGKEFAGKVLPSDKITHSNSVKGISVSRLKKIIKGIVRVLHSPKEISKMKQGEILVAPMTSPDYINVMRMAKAIITDHGGLMSHAAVVARELGVPCIVGTKVATQIFKDGDMVEVDANKGIVRKI